MRGQPARPVREGGLEKRTGSNPETALQADPTTTSPWSTPKASWSPSAGSATTRPGSPHCCWCSPTPVTVPRCRSQWPSRPAAACWSPACGPPAGRCSRSTRWRCPATGIGTRWRARNPTPGTHLYWPTSCAPTCPPTGRCRPTPNSPRPSPCSPAHSRMPSGTARAHTTSCVRNCGSTTRESSRPSPTNATGGPRRSDGV
jgi:hypothetical protein